MARDDGQVGVLFVCLGQSSVEPVIAAKLILKFEFNMIVLNCMWPVVLL